MSQIEHTWLDDQDGLIMVGDVLDGLEHLDDNSMDAVVTDPPYGLEFMGKEWDKLGGGRTSKPGIGARTTEWPHSRGWNEKRCTNCGHLSHGGSPCQCDESNFAAADDRWLRMQQWYEEWARAALRVLKPGGHMVVFGGTRTHHRLWCAAEDAGFEVRDGLMWLYGQGFPKSLDVGKAIDKAAGAEREVVGEGARFGRGSMRNRSRVEIGYRPTELNPEGGASKITAPATDAAKQWDGWGTALKPAWEPILLARKPLEGTVAANVLEHGTGGLNIDGGRIGVDAGWSYPRGRGGHGFEAGKKSLERNLKAPISATAGRWPANVVLECTCDDSQRVPEKARARKGEPSQERRYDKKGGTNIAAKPGVRREGGGVVHAPGCPAALLDEQMAGVSRFFYCAKASKKERAMHLICDCETVKLCVWQKQGQSRSDQTASTSHEQGISEEPSKDASPCSTSLSGRKRTGQSQEDTASTTRTETGKTTASAISASSPPPSTREFTEGATSEGENGGSRVRFAGTSFHSMPGTSICPPKDGRFTGVVVDATSPLWSETNNCAACGSAVRRTAHPTQKPLALMRWLVRMVTPPDGVVLDPFCGSGTTLMAAVEEGVGFVGIDLSPEYCKLAKRRVKGSKK